MTFLTLMSLEHVYLQKVFHQFGLHILHCSLGEDEKSALKNPLKPFL